ncbi:hypothetical protein OD350_15385 [Clostridium beijerinckii]|uniref:hypothetical protein n=1 Tax=Clostridium beijerinckii TaxID=1520 RepID=UPI00222779CD|nr:hypothetical protein [Clostridium beijerinckii]UYZ33647.1 hypothetical protein OD350_15385 [Clostridium beijerinckii]
MSNIHWCICLKSSNMPGKIIFKKHAGFGDKINKILEKKSSELMGGEVLKDEYSYADENKGLECENDFTLIKEINALDYENNETSKNDENIKNKVLINKVEGRNNMDSKGIIQRLNTCIIALNRSNTQLKTLGLKKAQAEKEYKVKQAEEILKLREDKYPATLIMELVKGNKEVAELRLQRDVAENAYFTCLDGIDNLRIEIELIKNKLKWLRAELNSL